MIKKTSSLCVSYINRNIKKRWQIGPEQVVKRSAKKNVAPAFHIRTLTSNDKENTINFLNRLFFRDEPLNLAVKLLDNPTGRCIELEEYVAKAMDDELSVAAVSDDQKLVGVVISGRTRKNEVVTGDIEACPNAKFKSILRVLAHLESQARIWEKVPSDCTTLVELKIASTDPEWRRRNMMKMLTEETERLAKKCGACGIHMSATSAFSAAVAERLGYKKIYSVMYADLPDAPQPEKPHVEASVYLKVF